jgi:hypothetical protein
MERIKEKLSGTTSTVVSSVGTDHTGHLKNIETLLMILLYDVLIQQMLEPCLRKQYHMLGQKCYTYLLLVF